MMETLVLTLIPLLVPLLIAGAKSVIPRIPKLLLPISAIVLGFAIELVTYLTGLAPTLNPVLGAVMGAVGVWLREVVDQVKKANEPGPMPVS